MSVLDHIRYRDLEGIRVGRFNHGINTSFIVYRLGDTLIDCGPTNQWKYVRDFIQQRPIQQLLLTHHHEDHSGNAGAIHKLTGIRPRAPQETGDILRKGFSIPLIQKIVWGSAGRADPETLPQNISIDGEPVLPIATPGHVSDMHCYLLPQRGWLFSADLYIASYLKFLRREEDVPTLLKSIHRVLALDFEVLLCPHRGVVKDGREKLRQKYDYLLDLAGRARDLRESGLAVKDITRQLLGPENFLSFASRYDFCKRNLIASCLQVDSDTLIGI
ncbi:MBL fold metallo-hydrolase [Microbulbifer aggregans]|uniref:MBL fold metallo-hydrolase n=1 Tax=Microbulbifer aggregans TaxID=1769779 RepID=UPI001CFD97E6|nr:MBL fold metallo-hydrolase [Microbulbifer aggregans]